MTSFEQAFAQGADAVELDVRLSSDAVPMVIHDATLERTTDGHGPVAALPAEGLSQIDAGQGQGIPRLSDVLEAFPTAPLIIEIKERAAGPPVAALLRHHNATNRVLVGSFQRAALRPFDDGEIPRAAARREAAWFWGWARLGWAVSLSRCAAFTVPEWYRVLHVVDDRFLAAARRRSLPVHVWTVNEPTDALRLWSVGVNGVITDYPRRMRDARSTASPGNGPTDPGAGRPRPL